MAFPATWTLPVPYPTGTGQILGLVGCIAWSTHMLGQLTYTFWRHKHRRSSSERMLRFIPPAEYAMYRAWAGLGLALLNFGQNMVVWNIALVIQPHIVILLGLLEWASRHGMDGDHKVCLTICIVIVMGALEAGMLYFVQVVPEVLCPLGFPLLYTLLVAALSLGESIKQRDGADKFCMVLMVIAILGGSTSIASVLYTPWTSSFLGYASLALYGIDLVLWLSALLAAMFVASSPKTSDGVDMSLEMPW